MFLVHWTIGQTVSSKEIYPWGKFSLAELVMVALAAAGNIINDYFDLRVDRINKPDRVLIGKYVKRRVAMISHQALNAFAVITGFFLAYDVGNYWLALVPIFIASTLWFYSLVLKKKVLLGNWAVAMLIALVPLYAGAIDLVHFDNSTPAIESLDEFINATFSPLTIIIISTSFAVFGFLLTLIREAQKDLEDLQGDSQVGYQTLPIRYGIKKTKIYIGALFLISIASFLAFVFSLFSGTPKHVPFLGLACLVVILPMAKSWWLTYKAQNKKDFHQAGNFMKLAMVFGLAFLAFVWYQ